MTNFLIRFCATGAFSGYLPFAPGTFGSAAAVFLWVILGYFGFWETPAQRLLVIITVFALGLWSTQNFLANPAMVAGSKKPEDPGRVVIDEWLGMLIALAVVAPLDLRHAAMAFVLFRLFDIIKPPPIGQLEKLPGAMGVLLDDAAGGLCAALVLFLPGWLI